MSEAYPSRFESAPQGPESGSRPVRPEWSRKQKRGYQRVRSLLWFWEAHRFQVLWVTLSTAEGGQAHKLTCQGSPKFPQLWSSKIPHPVRLLLRLLRLAPIPL